MRQRAEATQGGGGRDRRTVPLCRRRRPQDAQHPRPTEPVGGRRRAYRGAQRHRHRTAATEPHGIRQRRRDALRHRLGIHQEHTRKQSRRRGLLACPNDCRRRGSGIHRPQTGHLSCRGHRTCQSKRPAARKRHLRRPAENRLAGRTQHPVGMRRVSRHITQKQLRLQRHQRGAGVCRPNR